MADHKTVADLLDFFGSPDVWVRDEIISIPLDLAATAYGLGIDPFLALLRGEEGTYLTLDMETKERRVVLLVSVAQELFLN